MLIPHDELTIRICSGNNMNAMSMHANKISLKEMKHKSVKLLSSKLSTLKKLQESRQNSRRHRIYYRDAWASAGWIRLYNQLQIQSPLWIRRIITPWDITWSLNFVEGPHRIKMKLERHTLDLYAIFLLLLLFLHNDNI